MKILATIVVLLVLLSVNISAATFGPTDTTGTSAEGFGWTNCRMNKHANQAYVASAGDVITELHIFAESEDGGSNDTISIAVYDISSGADGASREGAAVKIPITSQSPSVWYSTSGLSISLTAGQTYGLAIGSEVGAVAGYRTPDGSLTAGRSLHAVVTLAATWTETSAGNRYYMLYATYTPGAAAGGEQIIMINE